MALHWNVENIKDHKSVCWIETGATDDDGNLILSDNGEPQARMNPVTEVLIFACISVGMGSITEDNAAEFYARLHLVEGGHGPLLVGQDGPTKLTTEDVQAHIGLTCNVGYETRAEWAQRMIIGGGDGLSNYGENRLSAEEREKADTKRADALRAAAELLWDSRDDEVLAIAQELSDRAERTEFYNDVSMTESLARFFRSQHKKEVKA